MEGKFHDYLIMLCTTECHAVTILLTLISGVIFVSQAHITCMFFSARNNVGFFFLTVVLRIT